MQAKIDGGIGSDWTGHLAHRFERGSRIARTVLGARERAVDKLPLQAIDKGMRKRSTIEAVIRREKRVIDRLRTRNQPLTFVNRFLYEFRHRSSDTSIQRSVYLCAGGPLTCLCQRPDRG